MWLWCWMLPMAGSFEVCAVLSNSPTLFSPKLLWNIYCTPWYSWAFFVWCHHLHVKSILLCPLGPEEIVIDPDPTRRWWSAQEQVFIYPGDAGYAFRRCMQVTIHWEQTCDLKNDYRDQMDLGLYWRRPGVPTIEMLILVELKWNLRKLLVEWEVLFDKLWARTLALPLVLWCMTLVRWFCYPPEAQFPQM